MKTSRFVEAQVEPDKKMIREVARRKRKEEAESLCRQQEEEEARMLAELQKETRLQRAMIIMTKIVRILCCCCLRCRRRRRKNSLAEKFSIKTSDEGAQNLQKFVMGRADRLMIETLTKVRSVERESKRKYRAFFRWFGSEFDREFEQSADVLRASCLNGRYNEVLDTLEDGDFTPNTVNSLGDTALYAVALRALGQSAEELDHDDDENEIAIGCWAVFKRKVKKCFKKKSPSGKLDLILKILILRGGDVNFIRIPKDKTEDGEGLVHDAAKWNRQMMVEWLESHYANFNVVTTLLRKTPLMLAAEKGHGEMVRMLLHKGCIDCINHIDYRGWTALHYAAAYCESQHVAMLLHCGADMTVRSEANRLALEEAQSRSRLENVEVLMFYKDRSRMFTHRILFYDQSAIKLNVLMEQERGRALKNNDNGEIERKNDEK